MTLAVVVIAFLGTLPLAMSAPWFTPLLVLPVAAAVWVLRARVVARPEDLEVCNGLGVRRIGWAEVDRFDVPARGPVVLRTTSGTSLRLTALSRRDLRELIRVAEPA